MYTANLPIILLAAAALIVACAKPEPQAAGPRPVVVESPQPAHLVGAEAYPGTVHARLEADLSFRVPGKIATRHVDMGARVERGTVLATLDPEDAKLNLNTAQAAVAAAEADLWLAQEEEKRYRDLKERGHVGQSVVDTRASQTKLAQARMEQAQSQFNLAKNQSRYTTLTADAPGVVTFIMAEPGNVVTAGMPVVKFAADGEREVRVSIAESQVESLRQAPALMITLLSQPDRKYAGKLRDINPQADRATRTHEARITILEADNSIPLGATATVAIGAAGDGHSFRLPATALGVLDQRNQPAVWIVKTTPDGGATVNPQPVEVVQYLDKAVIVSGKLDPQDRLVSAGVHRLVPGMAVVPIERKQAAAL
ncbi:MAG: efflux RND transporter periplasmic adaptor subunit [Panacagrimonas sp.]